jgi:hypothetical protein
MLSPMTIRSVAFDSSNEIGETVAVQYEEEELQVMTRVAEHRYYFRGQDAFDHEAGTLRSKSPSQQATQPRSQIGRTRPGSGPVEACYRHCTRVIARCLDV